MINSSKFDEPSQNFPNVVQQLSPVFQRPHPLRCWVGKQLWGVCYLDQPSTEPGSAADMRCGDCRLSHSKLRPMFVHIYIYMCVCVCTYARMVSPVTWHLLPYHPFVHWTFVGYMRTLGYQGDLIFNLEMSCLLFYKRFVNLFCGEPRKN